MNEIIIRKFNREKSIKLILALIIDLVGYASYTIPVFAETLDVVWAPLSGLFIFILFRRRWKLAIAGAAGGVFEEASTGMDFIPTATIIWTITYVVDKDKTLEKFVEKEVREQQIIDEVIKRKRIDK